MTCVPGTGVSRQGDAQSRVAPDPRVTIAVASASLVLAVAAWLYGPAPSIPALVFFLALAAAGAFVVTSAASLWDRRERLGSARKTVVLFLLAAIPVAFDPTTREVFNVTKVTLLYVGALLMTTLWIVEWLVHGRRPVWRNGLHWPVLGLVGWTIVSTVASISPPVSVFGTYGTFDGLLATIAFAIVFFAAADAFMPFELRRVLAVLFIGGGGPVALYGLIQLRDRLFDGTWDWIDWGGAAFQSKTIWSTFGNPNHLAGFASLALPLAVPLFLLSRSRAHRSLIVAIAVALGAEIVQTNSLGAWLATVVGAVTVGVLLLPDLRSGRAPRRVVVGTVVIAVALAVLAGASTRGFGERVSSGLTLRSGSTAALRVEVWKSAVGMGLERPLFGFGPDTVQLAFPAHQTAGFVRQHGPDRLVNGAHSLPLNQLATTGFPGLVALLALVGLAVALAVRAWRRTLHPEPALAGRSRELRLLLGGICGGIAAYLVQAAFNLQQIGLSLAFWALLGTLTVCARAAGGVAPNRSARRPQPPTSARQARWNRAVAAIVVMAATLPLLWLSTTVLRADHSYKAALTLRGIAQDPRLPATVRGDLTAESSRELDKAAATHPWEAEYLDAIGRQAIALASAAPSPEARLGLLEGARRNFERAIALQPTNARLLARHAGVSFAILELQPDRALLRSEALSSLRRAVASNPWEPRLALTLATELTRAGDAQTALAVLMDALRRLPEQPDLLRTAARLTEAVGRRAEARSLWTRLLEVVAGDGEARRALERLT